MDAVVLPVEVWKALTCYNQDDLHAEAVEVFARQGYHILCEKPMATTVADCIKMVRDMTEGPENKVFGIGHGKHTPLSHATCNEEYTD